MALLPAVAAASDPSPLDEGDLAPALAADRCAFFALRDSRSRGLRPPYFPALVHAGLDEPEAALDRLEHALEIGDTMIRDLRADSQWDRMRREPRFQALMGRLAYPYPAG